MPSSSAITKSDTLSTAILRFSMLIVMSALRMFDLRA